MVFAIRATSRWPLIVKLLLAVFGTVACFLIQLPIESRSFGDPFAVFLGCAFIVALLFGRLSGGVAVLLASALSTLFFEPFGLPHLMRALDLVQIEVFALLAAGAVFLADQIRQILIAISDQNQVLMAEDTRKTVRLQEVAHRIANNFSSLDALIRQRAKMSSNPTMVLAFEQASELIHVVARLSSRLNLAGDSRSVNSEVFVHEICDDLKACAPHAIEFKCEAESYDLPLGSVVPLGLVINELVTNALKYAFRDGRAGHIRVSFRRQQEFLVLAVEDNGVGIQGEIRGGGCGMPLLNGLARSLEGKLEFESSSAGTQVCLTFPAPASVPKPDARGYLH